MGINKQFLKRSLIYGVLAVLCGITAYWGFVMNTIHGPTGETDRIAAPSPEPAVPLQTEAHLYFANKDDTFLSSESRVLQNTGDLGQFAEKIVTKLIQGPKHGLIRTIPEATTLNALYVASDRTAFVDLSENISAAHPGGCQQEVTTIFSIVNSLILNVPEIDKVKILVGGKEAATMAGHVDLRFPLTANMLLVR